MEWWSSLLDEKSMRFMKDLMESFLLGLEDVENAIRLTVELVKRLDSDTVTSFTAL
ncbi:MAG: hypothetical protein ACE5KH_02615 [Candidatus Geothermarchaeales archaeon]